MKNDVGKMGNEEIRTDGAEQGRKLIPLAELQEPAAPVGEVRFKTMIPSVFLLIFGALLFSLHGTMAKAGGIVFAVIGLCGIGVRDHVTARLYEDSITLVDQEAAAGINISYDDIEEWNINNGIVIQTKDGGKFAVESFACGKALKILRKHIPDRETKQILNQKRKQEKLKSPLDLFRQRNR